MTDDLTLARLDAAIERAEAAGHHETAAEWRRERERLARSKPQPGVYKTAWITLSQLDPKAPVGTYKRLVLP